MYVGKNLVWDFKILFVGIFRRQSDQLNHGRKSRALDGAATHVKVREITEDTMGTAIRTGGKWRIEKRRCAGTR